MPLARRFSNSSVGSNSSRRLSLPSTAPSSTNVNPEKLEKMMGRRRKTRQQTQQSGDKENQSLQIQAPQSPDEKGNQTLKVPQSPTPYWKVAQERGTMSPRETRSAKKKKLSVSRFDFSPPKNPARENRSGLMFFSPPDQKANAQREKEELARKENERANRIKKARTSGQLLVFSPTFTHPAEYQDQANGTTEQEETEETTITTPNSERAEAKEEEEETSSPTLQDMEVEVGNAESKSQMSSFVMSQGDRNSESISDELKGLRAMIHQLVEQNKQSEMSHNQKEQLRALELEAQRHVLREEAQSKLFDKYESLQQLMKKKECKNSAEREQLMAQTIRLEAELAATNRETDVRIQGLEEARKNLEMQLASLQNEKSALSNKVSNLQSEVEVARKALNESKIMLEALKSEYDTEKEALEDNHKSLMEANSKLSKEFEQVKLNNESLNATIESYKDKINALENDLLPESEEQLRDALQNIRRLEKAESESQANISQYELEIESLKETTAKLREQKEEERLNFQNLNESSSQAYEKLTEDLMDKNRVIEDLKEKLVSTEKNLAAESKTVDHISEDLERLKLEMENRLKDLQKSLNGTFQALEVSETEKKELERKLHEACKQIDKDKNFMEEMFSTSKEKSVALEETDKLRMVMQRRIAELEQQLRETTEERDYARERMTTFNDREECLFQRLRDSDRVRRDLHNRVMQLSGNIRVYVRVRPVIDSEVEASKKLGKPPVTDGKKRKHDDIKENDSPFNFPGQLAGLDERMAKKSKNFGADDPTKNVLEVTEPYKDRGGLSERRKKWTFGFDHIFDPSHGQEDIWEATEPLVQSAIDGFNVTVFAYGQTGSGKTFTMLGADGNEGIISRAVGKLFDAKVEIEDLSRGDKKVELSVELLEVYNEKVRDLLIPSSDSDGKEVSLKVTANEAVGSKILPVTSHEEVHEILDRAQKRRCVKATSSNAVSSRSHMIFTILFQVVSKSGASRMGKLHVCDLAGSERLSKSNSNEKGVGSSLLKETKHINTSLSVLSNVIEKLQAGDANIPYRESKLTHLLQNSLGGNSKTLAIVCCNPLQSHFHESLCSLRFAAKVNKVDLKAVANFSC